MPPPALVATPARPADSRSLVAQYGWLLLSRLVSAGLQAATLAVLARWTSPAVFGVAASVTGLLLLVGTVADLGLSNLLLREQSRDPASPVAGAVLRLSLLVSAGLAVLVAAVLLAAAPVLHLPVLAALVPLAAWMAAEKNGDVWLSMATASGRSHLVTASLLVRRGASLGLFVLLAELVPGLGVPLAYALGMAAGSTAANLGMRARIGLPAARPGAVSYRATVRAASPFFWNSLAAMVRNVDVAIVSAAAGPAAAGLYAVPSRLTSPLRLLPTTMSPLVVRYAALGTRASLRAVGQVAALVMVVMPAALAGVAVLAPTLLRVGLGPGYVGAALPLRIICVGLVFAFAISLESAFLQGRGEESVVGRVGLVVTVLTVSGLFAGALAAGSTGAAVAVSVTFVVHFALLLGPTVRGVRALRG